MNPALSIKLPAFLRSALLSLLLAAPILHAQTTPGPSSTPGTPSTPAPATPTAATQTPQPPTSTPQLTATPPPTTQTSTTTSPATTPTQTPGQAAPPPANAPLDQPVDTIKVQVNEVNLIFTVTDKHGKFITGLKRENFGLLDDGRPPTAVLRFTQQTNLPLRVGIMLDTSSSIRQRFQFEQDSAIEFLLQILHLNDRAFVEGFDIETDVAQDFTNNVDLLNQGIRKLRPGGGTALFDALYKTCKDQMLPLQETGAVRRALILVSDGDDNYSRVQESDAIKMCQRADTIVYTISTNISPSKDKGDDVLKAISDATGGQAFYPTKLEDVAIGFHNIEEELRSQYHLVYRPAGLRMDGSFRTIYLQANDPRYKVRAQKGYFSPRPPQ
ncbi:VWA domain-containing protein [Tunturiibacter empetritectus]|uniref:VWFA-related protein n=2 Tax=Tunturiibacter TaxID=3154218 RepID=A0A852VM80_9BACT|nr:VWA domain-containing protein [Edaphobacter lichenicola]NYF92271.1 VWFA-related protein [Edaphobacter lichenicola]